MKNVILYYVRLSEWVLSRDNPMISICINVKSDTTKKTPLYAIMILFDVRINTLF